MDRVPLKKPPLEEVYRSNINEFIHQLGQKNPSLSREGMFSFWQADLEVRGPWNSIEFDIAATTQDAQHAIELAREAHQMGEIRRFVVRLTPKDDPAIATHLGKEHDWPPGTAIRPLRCESILCKDEDSGGRVHTSGLQIERLLPQGDEFAKFADAQLAGYGFGEPSPRDARALGKMYERWNLRMPDRLWFFVARHDNAFVGTITALPDPAKRTIGLYGTAVLAEVRHQGVGRALALYAIEKARELPRLAENYPRPPTIVALCDLGQYNERLFLTLGFRRAEIRPLYGGVPDWMLSERRRLRRLRWRMPP